MYESDFFRLGSWEMEQEMENSSKVLYALLLSEWIKAWINVYQFSIKFLMHCY